MDPTHTIRSCAPGTIPGSIAVVGGVGKGSSLIFLTQVSEPQLNKTRM